MTGEPVRGVATTGDARREGTGQWDPISGVTLAGMPLLRRTDKGFVPRTSAQLRYWLADRRNAGIDPVAWMGRLHDLAGALSAAETARRSRPRGAFVAPVGAGENHTSVVYAGFDPSEARDGRGRWTKGGAALSGRQGSVRDRFLPVGARVTRDPGDPVPVVLRDGMEVVDPVTRRPIMQPIGVSLADNIRVGEQLRKLPSVTSLNPIAFHTYNREAAMAALFYYYGPMDYQRIYARNGDIINDDYRDFGNYNYGVVAAAAGYTKEEAIRVAGEFNSRGTGDKTGIYGNSPRNLKFIEKGYSDYMGGMIADPMDIGRAR